MPDLDFDNIRLWLDENEKYASSIKADDPGFGIAQEMLGIISKARGSLHPSADSTANYMPNKEIIEQLSTLRVQAEQAALKGKR